MAWTTPPTFVAADPLAAAELNILSDDLAYLKGITDGVTFSGCKVSRASNLSIPNSTATDVTFVSEGFDVGSWWSSGATVTVPASCVPAGYTTVAISGSIYVRFVANGTGSRAVIVAINGTAEDSQTVTALSGETTQLTMPFMVVASAGDTIKVQVQQTSGGALNLDRANLAVFRVGPVA